MFFWFHADNEKEDLSSKIWKKKSSGSTNEPELQEFFSSNQIFDGNWGKNKNMTENVIQTYFKYVHIIFLIFARFLLKTGHFQEKSTVKCTFR
jgi:hypothetical protein